MELKSGFIGIVDVHKLKKKISKKKLLMKWNELKKMMFAIYLKNNFIYIKKI